jgi:hypothetical protein
MRMARTGLKTAFAVWCAAALLAGCGDKGTGPGSSAGPDGTRFTMESITYQVQGNTMIESVQMVMPGGTYCDLDSLVRSNDSSMTEKDTGEFDLTGDTLRLLQAPETMMVSGAVIQPYTQMLRKGSGTGLTGVWTDPTAGYTVLSGTLTSDEIAEENANNVSFSDLYGLTVEYDITSSQVLIYLSGQLDLAAMFINDWNYGSDPTLYPADSAMYNITIQKVSPKKLILTGNTSGESVTINWNVLSGTFLDMKYTEVFTSSNPAHTAYTYYSNPQTCPDDEYPLWWDGSFLTDNEKAGLVKALAKKSARAKGPGSLLRKIMPFYVK